jgi:hypothetical protein
MVLSNKKRALNTQLDKMNTIVGRFVRAHAMEARGMKMC